MGYILDYHFKREKITPYQNPNANIGPITLVIIPEYKETDPKYI
jgi:hypothetical protein